MSGRKHIIIATAGSQVLIFSSINKLCDHYRWNTPVFRNALSKAYKETGKRIVEHHGVTVEKRPFKV